MSMPTGKLVKALAEMQDSELNLVFEFMKAWDQYQKISKGHLILAIPKRWITEAAKEVMEDYSGATLYNYVDYYVCDTEIKTLDN